MENMESMYTVQDTKSDHSIVSLPKPPPTESPLVQGLNAPDVIEIKNEVPPFPPFPPSFTSPKKSPHIHPIFALHEKLQVYQT